MNLSLCTSPNKDPERSLASNKLLKPRSISVSVPATVTSPLMPASQAYGVTSNAHPLLESSALVSTLRCACLANIEHAGVARSHHGLDRHDLQVSARRQDRMARYLARRIYHQPPLYHRQIFNWPLPGSGQRRLYVWRGGFRCGADDLDLLCLADTILRRQDHPGHGPQPRRSHRT